MMEKGSARLGMTVAHTLRRKRKITATTSARVSAIVNCTSRYDSRIVSDRSYSTSMWTLVGSSILNCGKRLDGVGHGNRVRARLALNAQRDRPLTVPVCIEPRRRPLIFHAVNHLAKVVEPHRRAVAVRHDHAAVFVGVH